MFYKGFTLIELMMVIAITGILVTLAWPVWHNHLIKTRRIDGQIALMDLAGRLEQYFHREKTYESATIGTGNKTDILSSGISPEGWYQLSITSKTDVSWTVQATPIMAQSLSDTLCQSLTLNEKGIKGIVSGMAGKPQGLVGDCW